MLFKFSLRSSRDGIDLLCSSRIDWSMNWTIVGRFARGSWDENGSKDIVKVDLKQVDNEDFYMLRRAEPCPEWCKSKLRPILDHSRFSLPAY
jgi:hypothetical protein